MQKYSNSVQDTAGNAIEAASVSVYDPGTTNLSTIYSDDAATVTTNPQITDSKGEFSFYAANGRYDIQVTKTGVATQDLKDVLLYDPGDGTSGLTATVSLNSTDYVPVDQAGVGKKSLLSTLADWIVQTYASFTQSGTGAVATDVSAKLQDMPASPIDMAVPSDGTDATTALDNLFAKDWVTLAPKTYTSTTGAVVVKNKVEGSPTASLVASNASATYDFTISTAGAILRDVNLTGVSAQALAASGSSTTGVTLDNVNITNTPGSQTHHGLQINVAGAGGWKIGGRITADGYAVLLNDTMDTGGDIISGLIATSNYSDAVEINVPTNSVSDWILSSSILKTTTTGSSTSSGFPIGIASGRNAAIGLISIPQSRREMIHVEDGVKTLSFVGIVGRDAKRNGVIVLPDAAGDARGTNFVGLNLEADSTVASMTGFQDTTLSSAGAKSVSSITRSGQVATVTTAAAHGFYTGQGCTMAGADQTEYNIVIPAIRVTSTTTFEYYVQGSPASPATGTITATGGSYFVPGTMLVASRLKDFDTGLDSQFGMKILDKNIIEESSTLGISAGSSIIIGENLLLSQVADPAALVSFAAAGGIVGKIYSNKAPTAIFAAKSAGLPGVLRGFTLPVVPTAYTGGSGSNPITVITLPDLARGRVIVQLRSGASTFVYASADIVWDGTTLTVSNPLRKNDAVGTGGAQTFANTSGVLTINLSSAANGVWSGIVDFTGEWVKA